MSDDRAEHERLHGFSDDYRPPGPLGRVPLIDSPSDYYGPPGFVWLVRGLLGGMPRPGLTRPLTEDLEKLRHLGVGALVTLTEEWQPPVDEIAAYGIDSHYYPLADMAAPSVQLAEEICKISDSYIAAGRAVVYHCRGGKGRTGTLLASQMIWYEPDAAIAVHYARSRNRCWIESAAQLKFLDEFATERRREAHVVGEQGARG